VRGVAGAEEVGDPPDDRVVLLVVADAASGAHARLEPVEPAQQGDRQTEHRAQVHRTVGVEGEDLFRVEAVQLGVPGRAGVVGQVATGGLGAGPFPYVPLYGAGAGGELGRGQRAVGQRGPESEPLAEHDQARGAGRAGVGDGCSEQTLETGGVDRGCLRDGHGEVPFRDSCLAPG
jgi:hypothetical protein